MFLWISAVLGDDLPLKEAVASGTEREAENLRKTADLALFVHFSLSLTLFVPSSLSFLFGNKCLGLNSAQNSQTLKLALTAGS